MNIIELYPDIKSYWYDRKDEMLKRWDFYYGEPQRYYLPRFQGEDDYEYATRIDSATIENHCGKTCDVIVGYLYGQPNSESRVAVRAVDLDGNIVENIQKLLKYNIWRYNDIDSFRIDVALMMSVTGVAVIHKEFIDTRTELPFPDNASKEDKIKYGTIRYDLFDSVDTLPVARVSPKGEVYPRSLGAIIRMYSRDNFSGNRYVDRLQDKKYKVEDVLEYFDDNSFQRRIIDHGVISNNDDTNTVQVQNPYGSIKIPFTIFRNYGDPMYLEGESDISNMMNLQSALNEVMTDDKATISYHSFPILKLAGGATMPKNFVRKANSIIEYSGAPDDLSYLTWDNVLEASKTFKSDLRESMTVTSGVSQLSRGNAGGVGQVRSGAGLKTLFQADINCISLKIPHLKKAEKELVYSTIKMWEEETGQKLGDFICEVEFPEDFVGIDKLLNAQTEQIEITQGTESIRDSIKDDSPDAVSEQEIDDKLNRIMKEKQWLEEMRAKAKITSPAVPKAQTTDSKSQQQQ